MEAKTTYLSNWVDSHISDGDFVLRKPVLFTEVGSRWDVDGKGVHERDVLLKIVYDKIYESAKKRQAGAGALIWQLLVEDVDGYSDQFSFIPQYSPSTYKLIEEQSCRLQRISAGHNRARKPE